MILVDGPGFEQIQNLKRYLRDTIDHHEKIKGWLCSRFLGGVLPDSEKAFYGKLEENFDQIIEDMSNEIKYLEELDLRHHHPKGRLN